MNSPAVDVGGWQRSGSRYFSFRDRAIDLGNGRISLRYSLDGIELEETIELPRSQSELSEGRIRALDAALDLLHWIAAVSYWKAGCPADVRFLGRQPDRWQADRLNRLYRDGLAEMAYRNGLDTRHWRPFMGFEANVHSADAVGLARRSLVPMGGGKDSLVAWNRLERQGDRADSVQIGSSDLIKAVGARLPGQHWQIRRNLDPKLAELNRRGAWNGHVPVTAINSAILALAAIWLDYDRVVFANERSADEASLVDRHGEAVNHQFSKSHAFECLFDDWVRRYVAADLGVFSILRRDRELAICREFAELKHFHDLFSSCNRNFHLDGPRTRRWCGGCPKCHFVFLALAPFMNPASMKVIFGRDLLDQEELVAGFAALLALDGTKPFECVGEANEARAAVLALAANPVWSGHEVVRNLAQRLDGIAVPTLESLCQPGGASLIPAELLDAA